MNDLKQSRWSSVIKYKWFLRDTNASYSDNKMQMPTDEANYQNIQNDCYDQLMNWLRLICMHDNHNVTFP